MHTCTASRRGLGGRHLEEEGEEWLSRGERRWVTHTPAPSPRKLCQEWEHCPSTKHGYCWTRFRHPALKSILCCHVTLHSIPETGSSSGLNLCSERGLRVLVWFGDFFNYWPQSPLKQRDKLTLTQASSDPDTEHEAWLWTLSLVKGDSLDFHPFLTSVKCFSIFFIKSRWNNIRSPINRSSKAERVSLSGVQGTELAAPHQLLLRLLLQNADWAEGNGCAWTRRNTA